ncbi:MAG TPA: glycosyltransferase family 39 protein, partial [Candidatus Dormibacteraeota bacterium]|nr:glycosyltransferase family 39 protein [Candidatus Dormibacteraeota bacterium]
MVGLLTRRSGLICVVAALAVAFAGSVYAVTLGDSIRYADEQDYVTLAANVVSKGSYSFDGVHPTAFRPPAYPLLLSVVHWLGGGIVAYRLVSVAFLVLVAVGVWFLARRLAGPVAAALAVVVAAAYPLGFYTAGTLYPQTMAAAFLVWGLVAVAAVPAAATRGRALALALAAGVLFGLLVLTVPTFTVTFAIALAWLLAVRRRAALLPAVVAVVAAGAVLLPWTVRNEVDFHTL